MANEKPVAKVDEVDELSRLKAEVDALKGMLTGSKSGKVLQEVDTRFKREDRVAGGGWLVKTPIETYSGVTESVYFVDGMALVDEEMEGADMKVHRLEHDHGYQVAALTGAEMANMRKLIAMRQNSGGGKTVMEKMTLPSFGGR